MPVKTPIRFLFLSLTTVGATLYGAVSDDDHKLIR